MADKSSRYHREMAEQKRAALVDAGTRLFLGLGYDGTSLAKVAAEAGVSRATLFKQFPTKAELFAAIVTKAWSLEGPDDPIPGTGGLRAGLAVLGGRYADVMTRPGMVDLFRIVIAETPRFPEIGRAHFDLGKMPFYDLVRRYLGAEHDAGHARVEDLDVATTQFLGMIASFVFWPRMLLLDWNPGAEAVAGAVREAVETMHARYAAR
jgi:AcrR family transcriptional regulator